MLSRRSTRNLITVPLSVAALENVRIQLLRIGAGVGSAEDMREEVAALQELASDGAVP